MCLFWLLILFEVFDELQLMYKIIIVIWHP